MVRLIVILFIFCNSVFAQQLYKAGNVLVKDNVWLYDGAKQFVAAVGSLTDTEKKAINYLVYELKRNNLWDSSYIYPFIGASANTHKYQLRDPRDLDAAFRLTFSGTCTHNSDGVIFGNDGYANTFVVPNAQLTGSYNMLAISCRTNIVESGANHKALMGTYVSSTSRMTLTKGNSWLYYYNSNSTGNQGVILGTNSQGNSTKGIVMGYKNSSGRRIMFQSQIRATNTITTDYGTLPSNAIYIGQINNLANSNYGIAVNFAYISNKDISDSKAVILFNIIKTYLHMIGREYY